MFKMKSIWKSLCGSKKVSDLFFLPPTIPIGRRTGFEANAAAAPINATPARAFNATALTSK